MEKFWLCFVPLFVAVDAIGVLPMFMGLTEGLDRKRLQKVVIESVITATLVALVFVFFGRAILSLLGISVADFMVAGGVLLFAISVNDLLTYEKRQRMVDPESMGAVPIGVPLITGPAVLTTSIILLNTHGIYPTAIALVINIVIAGIVFWSSSFIYGILGKVGSRTLSKLASLLLAGIAVMIVRKGLTILIKGG